MVYCCAIGCSNDCRKGFIMKRFPSDPERRKIWAAKVNRENWNPTEGSRLCEAHFTPDMFEQNRADGKRMLRWNAIPTIFPHNPQTTIRKPPKKRFLEEETHEIKEEPLDPTFDACSTVASSIEDSQTCSSSSTTNVPSSALCPRLNRQNLSPSDPKRRKVFVAKAKRENGKPTDASPLCPTRRSPEKETCEDLKKDQSDPTADICPIARSSEEDIPTCSSSSTSDVSSSTLHPHLNKQKLSTSDPKRRKGFAANAKRVNRRAIDTSRQCPTKRSPEKETCQELNKEQSVPTTDVCFTVRSSKEDTSTSSFSTSNVSSSTLRLRSNRQKPSSSGPKRRKGFAANAKRVNRKPIGTSRRCRIKRSPEKETSEELNNKKSDLTLDMCSAVQSSTEDILTCSSSLLSNVLSSALRTRLNRQDPPLVPKQRKVSVAEENRGNGKPTNASPPSPTIISPEEIKEEPLDPALDMCSTVLSLKEDISTCSRSSISDVQSSALYTRLNMQDLFPDDPKWWKIPTIILKIENLKPTDASRLCEAYFIPEMFEQNRADGKRVLTWDAFTTIFSHILEKKSGKPPTQKFSEKETCELKEEQSTPELDMCFSVPSSVEDIQNLSKKDFAAKAKRENGKPTDASPLCPTRKSPEKETCEELGKNQSDPTFDICSTVRSSEEDISTCSSSSTPNVPSSSQLPSMNREDLINRLNLYQKGYSRVMKENNILKAKLIKMRKSFKKLEENDFLKCLKKVFNDKQIEALSDNTIKSKIKWDNETINKGLKIKHSCGKKGYEELLNLNFPLPSLRTLRRKVQKSKCHPPN